MTSTSVAQDLAESVRESVSAVRGRSARQPHVAIVLGTGLGGLGEVIDLDVAIPYGELPGFPEPTVETHSGRLLLGTLRGTAVVVMQGRYHRYEGYSLQEVTLPIRVMARLGADTLVVSNVSGGMNPAWRAGDLVVLEDHLNLLGDSPLIGPNLDEFGPRFPDMSAPYDAELRELALAAGDELDLELRAGVYAAVTGPALETRAEYRMLRALGADVVGMSTVPEVLVARHMAMRVLGLSIITDECFPDTLQPVDVSEIIAVAKETEPSLTRVITRVVEQLQPTLPA